MNKSHYLKMCWYLIVYIYIYIYRLVMQTTVYLFIILAFNYIISTNILYSILHSHIPLVTGWCFTNWKLRRPIDQISTHSSHIYVFLNFGSCVYNYTYGFVLIISFRTFNVSNLCNLHPWRWSHGWAKGVGIYRIYTLSSVYFTRLLVTL
jgi:hypothetical protein